MYLTNSARWEWPPLPGPCHPEGQAVAFQPVQYQALGLNFETGPMVDTDSEFVQH